MLTQETAIYNSTCVIRMYKGLQQIIMDIQELLSQIQHSTLTQTQVKKKKEQQ